MFNFLPLRISMEFIGLHGFEKTADYAAIGYALFIILFGMGFTMVAASYSRRHTESAMEMIILGYFLMAIGFICAVLGAWAVFLIALPILTVCFVSIYRVLVCGVLLIKSCCKCKTT